MLQIKTLNERFVVENNFKIVLFVSINVYRYLYLILLLFTYRKTTFKGNNKIMFGHRHLAYM